MQTAFELLSFIARSANRLEALEALEAGPTSRAELQATTGIPRATLSRILADGRDRDLVERTGYEFALSPLGRILVGEIRELFGALETGTDLQALDPWLPLAELGLAVEDLSDARVTLPTPVDPLAPVHRTAELLSSGPRVRGLCNNVIPELICTLRDAGTEIEVVTTADAFEIVSTNPTISLVVKEMLESGRLDLAVSSERIPQLAIETDGTVLLEVTDDGGTIHGLIESESDSLLSWFASDFDGFQSQAQRVAPGLLVP